MTRSLLLRRLSGLLLMLGFVGGMCAAQVNTTGAGGKEIIGVVTDQQGAVLPDATVLLLGQAMRLQQTRSGPRGEFTFYNVAPGK